MSGALNTDAVGNCYVASSFSGNIDLDPSVAGTFTLSSNGGYDICLQKFDANGNFIWAKQMGGNGNEINYDLVLNNISDIFLTGSFEGTADFDPSAANTNLISNGNSDIFVQALDLNGNLIWANSVGGPGQDFGSSLCLDNNHNIFISGTFASTADFNPGVGTYNLSSNNISDCFILKLNQNILSIKENVAKINAGIYPNPTAGHLTIELDKEYQKIEVELTNIAGQMLLKKVETFAGKIIDLDMDVPPGVYLLSLKGDVTGSSKFKIIKT